MRYIIIGIDSNTSETVYLNKRGYIFLNKITDDCYHTDLDDAISSMNMGITLYDDVINIMIKTINS